MTFGLPENAPRQRSLLSSDKGDVHIPGAGTFAMYLLVASLTMLFVASILGYLYIRFIRFSGQPWPPLGYPHLPTTLWVSTVVILLTSVTIQIALNAVKKDNKSGLLAGLYATLALASLFLVLQCFNWWEMYSSIPANFDRTGPYINLFYILTALHAAHVIGGIIPLFIVMFNARRGRYVANYHPGVRYCTIYFHFLDVIWVVLFAVIYLI